MPKKNFLEDRKKLESKQNELIKAHYAGAVVLLVAAAGFLALVFVLNRAFDFSRFAYRRMLTGRRRSLACRADWQPRAGVVPHGMQLSDGLPTSRAQPQRHAPARAIH
jgi:hypothetical protein